MAALQVRGRGRLLAIIIIISLSCRNSKKKNSLDAFNPLVLLLCGRSRDPVNGVVSLDDPAVCLRLAGLDHLIFAVGDEELEAVLGRSMWNKCNQRGKVLKQVKTVIECLPASLSPPLLLRSDFPVGWSLWVLYPWKQMRGKNNWEAVFPVKMLVKT